MDLKAVLKVSGTTGFIATRVVGIVAAGLFAVAMASSIKNRLNPSEVEVEVDETEEMIED